MLSSIAMSSRSFNDDDTEDDNSSWCCVSHQIIKPDGRPSRVEDLHKHVINVDSLDQHPCEDRQEQEVEHAGDRGANALVVGGVQAAQEQDLGKQEAQTEVAVNRRSLASQP